MDKISPGKRSHLCLTSVCFIFRQYKNIKPDIKDRIPALDSDKKTEYDMSATIIYATAVCFLPMVLLSCINNVNPDAAATAWNPPNGPGFPMSPVIWKNSLFPIRIPVCCKTDIIDWTSPANAVNLRIARLFVTILEAMMYTIISSIHLEYKILFRLISEMNNPEINPYMKRIPTRMSSLVMVRSFTTVSVGLSHSVGDH